MKYLSTILICIFLLIGGCKSGGGGDADVFIPGAGGEDYTDDDYKSDFRMWESLEKPFADADKTAVGDINMCWAATAANLLTWAGWAADEDDAFDEDRLDGIDNDGDGAIDEDRLKDANDDNQPGFAGIDDPCQRRVFVMVALRFPLDPV